MSSWRFDGRTAIVTGAGGNPSLGRAYACLLGSLGASVVVNDVGDDPETPGYVGSASAAAVATEINAAGGRAVADSHSVATEEGANAIIQTALDAFGRVDILINNAGISIPAAFDELTARDFQRHIDINVMGTVWTCRAAWPHMRGQGYGRIVNTTSRAMTGVSLLSAYSASKGAVFALTRALAAEGAPLGIKVNSVSPGAFTRMVQAQQERSSPMYEHARRHLPPEIVAPVVAYLSHAQCPVSGECIESLGGDVKRMVLAQNQGFTDPTLSMTSIAQHWDAIISDEIEQVIASGEFDPSQWDLKPYRR